MNPKNATRNCCKFIALAAVALALTPATQAQSQPDEQQDIEEVVITASKRGATSLKETPIAISAVDGSQLDWRDSRNFNDFALLMPSVQFQDLGPGDKEYILRGINATGPAAVGAYFDEVVITASDSQDGGGKNADIYLTDLERIEVLNGPQGTLYGANSMSGTVRFITRKPDPEAFDANFTLNLGTTDGEANTNLEGMANVPVSDSAALRFVGWFKDDSGWIDQPTYQGGPRENINTNETTGARVMFRYSPGANFRLDLMALTQTTSVGGTSRYTEDGTMNYCGRMTEPDVQEAILRFDADVEAGDRNNPMAACDMWDSMATLAEGSTAAPRAASGDYQNLDLTETPWEDQTDLISVTLEFGIGAGSLTATTGIYDRDIEYNFDSTWILNYFGVGGESSVALTHEPQVRSITSTEVRYASDWGGSVEIVGGVYLYEEEFDFNVEVTRTNGMGIGLPFVGDPDRRLFGGDGSGDWFNSQRDFESEAQAIFGEATIELSPASELILGVRNFSADLTSNQSTPVPFGPIPEDRIIESSDSKTTFKITYHQTASETLNWYATYSQGFRIGGINNVDQPFAPGTPIFFNSDTLDNLEAGFKFATSDRRWTGEVAAFFMTWSDIQTDPRDPESAAIPYIINGGDAEVLGFEASILFRPSQNLTISFGGSWTDASLSSNQPRVRSVNASGMPIVSARHVNLGQSGDAMPNVPEIQLFATLDLNWLIGGRPLRIGVEAAHRGETNSEYRPESAFNIAIDAYTLINFRIAYQVAEKWRISAGINNVTDEVAVFDTIFNVQETPAVVGARPQTIGFALDYRF